MFDDFLVYYYENVVTAYVEYVDRAKKSSLGQSKDLRDALVAANALFHLREHLPQSSALSRKDAEQKCFEYALLGDIANVAKHGSLTSSTPHGSPLVNTAGNLREELLSIEYADETGVYRYSTKSVLVILSDGSWRALLEVLTNVMNFWERHLNRTGLLKGARIYACDVLARQRSRTECSLSQLSLAATRGLRFTLNVRMLRYEPATGTLVPVDCTGGKMVFNLYKPHLAVDVLLKADATGKEHRTQITLTEAEYAALSRLANDAEREELLLSLPSTQATLRRLASEAGIIGSGPEEQLRIERK